MIKLHPSVALYAVSEPKTNNKINSRTQSQLNHFIPDYTYLPLPIYLPIKTSQSL